MQSLTNYDRIPNLVTLTWQWHNSMMATNSEMNVAKEEKCLGMVYKRRKMSRYGVHAYRFRAHTQMMREILCALASALMTFLVKLSSALG